MPHGAALLAFATACHHAHHHAHPTDDPGLDAARRTLVDLLGTEGLAEAAATVAAFNGLVRVADGTGIQLDAGVLDDSADFRAELGVDEFPGASNTRTVPVAVDRRSIPDLFA